jgi:hypothetical protein
MIYERRIAKFLTKNFEQINLLKENWGESPNNIKFKTRLLKQRAKKESLRLDRINENFKLYFTLDKTTTATLELLETAIKITINFNVSE